MAKDIPSREHNITFNKQQAQRLNPCTLPRWIFVPAATLAGADSICLKLVD